MNEFLKKMMDSIAEATGAVDAACFDKLLNMIVETERKGKKIIATGLGKNVPICEKFVGSMLSFGLNANFMHSNTAIHGDLGMIQEGDLVIMLTKSGNTDESIALYEHLATRNAHLWLITFDENGALAKKFPNVLFLQLNHEGDLWNIAPINSSVIYLIILHALAVSASSKLGVTLEQYSKNHPGGAIGKKLAHE